MKKIKCKVIVNTKNGYCLTPKECESIREAREYGKTSCGFAYRIFTDDKRVINGYCNQ